MKLKIIIFLITLSSSVYAQGSYRSGYIITHSNDTLNGYIKYSESSNVYSTCWFKKEKKEKAIKYAPTDINGYRYNDDRFFESKVINVSDSLTEKVFLEVLVKGTASLYKYKKQFFVQNTNSPLHMLKNERQDVIVNNKKMIRQSNDHIKTLNLLFSDCQKIKKAVQKVTLREKPMTLLVEEYNNCIDATYVAYKSNKQWLDSDFGFALGVNSSKLSFISQEKEGYMFEDMSRSNSLMPGISLNFKFPRLNERLSLITNILYVTSTYSDESITKFNHADSYNSIYIQQNKLNIPLGIRYTFTEKLFTPFINFGVSNSISLSSRSDFSRIVIFKGEEVLRYEGEGLYLQTSQYGVWGGLGISSAISPKNKAFIEFRYEGTQGIHKGSRHSNSMFDSRVKNLQLFIGISF